jgi:outer membrane receptor for ferrienterochelin and colicins
MRCSSSYISRFFWLLTVGVSLITIEGAIFAQESSTPDALSLEELLNSKVYSASKYEQREAEAPSSISVISGDEIRRNGYRTLNEALRSVTGFYTKNHGSYSTLGVRGFAPPGDTNSRILLLVNGHAINNNIDGSAPLENDFLIDMDLIDRIEIVRGPSSSLYGANAFFGVVNVIIRTGNNNRGTVISGEAGSLGTYKETAIYSLDRRGTQALFSASYWDTAAPGHLDSIEDPIGSKSNHDQTRRAFALVSSHGFTLQAAASSAEEKAPSAAQWCGGCHQTDTHSTSFRGYSDLQYEHTVLKGTQFTARAYYDTYVSHGKYNDIRQCSDAMCHGQLVDYDSAHGDKIGAEVKLTRRFLDKHRITLGADYSDNFRQAQQNYYYTPAISTRATTNFAYARTSALWGIYGEGEFRLHPKLILNVGVRSDLYNYSVGSTTNPRAALIFTPRKTTTLKFLYGTAFRAPSFSERYSAGMASLPAPNLKPENIRTLEGVWEQQLGKRVTLSAAGFYNHIGSYIEAQTVIVQGHDGPIDGTTFLNSRATAKGAELELKGKLPSGIEGRVSYTYQDAHNDTPSSPLLDSPKHLAKLNVSAPLLHRMLTPAIEAQYMSRSATLWPATTYSAPPLLINANLSSRLFWGGFSLSGGAYNLVGRSISPPTIGYFEQIYTVKSTSLLPDDRRSFRLKLTWTSSERGDTNKTHTHSEGGQ